MPTNWGEPNDAEEMFIAWCGLLPEPVGIDKPSESDLPCRMVTGIVADDDMVTAYSTVSVHHFAATRTAARDLGRAGHKHILSLGPQDDITLPSGPTARIDRLQTTQRPIYVHYDDANKIFRYVSRYKIDHRFVAA